MIPVERRGINWSRILLGGLAAGLVLNLGRYVAHALVFRDRWTETLKSLPSAVSGRVQIATVGFLAGFFVVGYTLLSRRATARVQPQLRYLA